MNTRKFERRGLIITETLMVLLAVLWAVPIYYLIVTTLKSPAEATASPLALPSTINLQNYIDAWQKMEFPRAFANTLFITAMSVFLIVLFGSMAGYALARTSSKLGGRLFLFFLAGLVVPFQMNIVSLYKIVKALHLMNSPFAVILVDVAVNMPQAVFLFREFAHSTVPVELEEAAEIDGCGTMQKFFTIVFPLLKPVMATVIIIVTLNVWNEFMTPLLFLQSRANDVILQEVSRNIGQFSTDWTAMFPMMMLGVAPLMIFYLFMQKYIIAGVAAGAVKGLLKMEITDFGKIMVIVPHQDDELLLTAGVLYSAAHAGLNPHVVMVTNGDYGCHDHSVGYARLRETLTGVEMLGVPNEQVTFLGYADTGMPRAESFLAGLYDETDENKVHPSHCGTETYGLPEKPDFHAQHFGMPAPYTKAGFVQDLKAVLDEIEPDSIITTALCDTHGDHSGLYQFICDELRSRREAGKKVPTLYTGIVHSPAGDENWPLRDGVRPLTCPEGLESASTLRWENRIVLPVPQEMLNEDLAQNLKHRAISCHKTALKPDAVDFLYSFVKADEVFWKVDL